MEFKTTVGLLGADAKMHYAILYSDPRVGTINCSAFNSPSAFLLFADTNVFYDVGQQFIVTLGISSSNLEILGAKISAKLNRLWVVCRIAPDNNIKVVEWDLNTFYTIATFTADSTISCIIEEAGVLWLFGNLAYDGNSERADAWNSKDGVFKMQQFPAAEYNFFDVTSGHVYASDYANQRIRKFSIERDEDLLTQVAELDVTDVEVQVLQVLPNETICVGHSYYSGMEPATPVTVISPGYIQSANRVGPLLFLNVVVGSQLRVYQVAQNQETFDLSAYIIYSKAYDDVANGYIFAFPYAEMGD